MILTFCIALLIGLEFGMMCGFLISVTYLLYYAARPGVKVKKGYVRSLSLLSFSFTPNALDNLKFLFAC